MSNPTPAQVLASIVAALNNVSGLIEAQSHLGVAQQGSKKIDRSFAVIPVDCDGNVGGSRFQANAVGIRWGERFRVELGHILKPKSGATAYTQALTDLHSALAQIATDMPHHINVTGVRRAVEANGQYLIQSIDLRVQIQLSLSA